MQIGSRRPGPAGVGRESPRAGNDEDAIRNSVGVFVAKYPGVRRGRIDHLCVFAEIKRVVVYSFLHGAISYVGVEPEFDRIAPGSDQ